MNLSTVIVALLILVICVAIVAKGIINRKNGKSSCSCGCSGCAMADVCHKNNQKTK